MVLSALDLISLDLKYIWQNTWNSSGQKGFGQPICFPLLLPFLQCWTVGMRYMAPWLEDTKKSQDSWTLTVCLPTRFWSPPSTCLWCPLGKNSLPQIAQKSSYGREDCPRGMRDINFYCFSWEQNSHWLMKNILSVIFLCLWMDTT